MNFSFNGKKGRLVNDSQACARLWRSVGGSDRIPPPLNEMDDNDIYQKWAQHMVQVATFLIFTCPSFFLDWLFVLFLLPLLITIFFICRLAA